MYFMGEEGKEEKVLSFRFVQMSTKCAFFPLSNKKSFNRKIATTERIQLTIGVIKWPQNRPAINIVNKAISNYGDLLHIMNYEAVLIRLRPF